MQQIADTVVGPIEYRLEEPHLSAEDGAGAAPVVLVLNGGHASRDSRYGHEHLTEQGYRVLTPSRPGYDDTPTTVGKTAQAAADAMVALLDELKVEKVHVIGISAAGPTALAMAARRPDRVRDEVPHAELVEVPADSHFIWIGTQAEQVRARRVEFLKKSDSSDGG